MWWSQLTVAADRSKRNKENYNRGGNPKTVKVDTAKGPKHKKSHRHGVRLRVRMWFFFSNSFLHFCFYFHFYLIWLIEHSQWCKQQIWQAKERWRSGLIPLLNISPPVHSHETIRWVHCNKAVNVNPVKLLSEQCVSESGHSFHTHHDCEANQFSHLGHFVIQSLQLHMAPARVIICVKEMMETEMYEVLRLLRRKIFITATVFKETAIKGPTLVLEFQRPSVKESLCEVRLYHIRWSSKNNVLDRRSLKLAT